MRPKLESKYYTLKKTHTNRKTLHQLDYYHHTTDIAAKGKNINNLHKNAPCLILVEKYALNLSTMRNRYLLMRAIALLYTHYYIYYIYIRKRHEHENIYPIYV